MIPVEIQNEITNLNQAKHILKLIRKVIKDGITEEEIDLLRVRFKESIILIKNTIAELGDETTDYSEEQKDLRNLKRDLNKLKKKLADDDIEALNVFIYDVIDATKELKAIIKDIKNRPAPITNNEGDGDDNGSGDDEDDDGDGNGSGDGDNNTENLIECGLTNTPVGTQVPQLINYKGFTTKDGITFGMINDIFAYYANKYNVLFTYGNPWVIPEEDSLYIKDKLGNFSKVSNLILKKDKMMYLRVSDGEWYYGINVGISHILLKSDNTPTIAADIQEGDHLLKVNDNGTIVEVIVKDKIITSEIKDVYDLTMESNPWYADSFGLIHHNTYSIDKNFKIAGLDPKLDYSIISNTSSPLNLYKELFKARDNKFIVVDNCDEVLSDPDGFKIIKTLLESDNKRELSLNTKDSSIFNVDGETTLQPFDAEYVKLVKEGKVPNKFIFDGKCILVSNLDSDNANIKAINTDSKIMDINLETSNIYNRIKSLVDNGDFDEILDIYGISKDAVNNALKTFKEIVDEDPTDKLGQSNIQTFMNLIKIYASGVKDPKKFLKYKSY